MGQRRVRAVCVEEVVGGLHLTKFTRIRDASRIDASSPKQAQLLAFVSFKK